MAWIQAKALKTTYINTGLVFNGNCCFFLLPVSYGADLPLVVPRNKSTRKGIICKMLLETKWLWQMNWFSSKSGNKQCYKISVYRKSMQHFFFFLRWEKQIFMVVMRSNITKSRDIMINYYFPHQLESAVLFRRHECLHITKELPYQRCHYKKEIYNLRGVEGGKPFSTHEPNFPYNFIITILKFLFPSISTMLRTETSI